MSGSEIESLRSSFQRLRQQGMVPALIFYRRLFALDPALRPLFREDIEVQSQKLLNLLGQALELLERPTQLTAVLVDLGARHVSYGVRDHDYDTVGQALLGMLQEALGQGFTPEVRSAWIELYGTLASTMLTGATKARRATGAAMLSSAPRAPSRIMAVTQ